MQKPFAEENSAKGFFVMDRHRLGRLMKSLWRTKSATLKKCLVRITWIDGSSLTPSSTRRTMNANMIRPVTVVTYVGSALFNVHRATVVRPIFG